MARDAWRDRLRHWLTVVTRNKGINGIQAKANSAHYTTSTWRETKHSTV